MPYKTSALNYKRRRSLIKLLSPYFSASGVIVSAVLASYATIVTNRVSTEINLLKNQNTHNLERAKFFKENIADLSSGDQDKSFLAFLTLWQVYREEEERNSILLAALTVPNDKLVQALLNITDETNSQRMIDTLERAKKNGVKNADLILERIDPKHLKENFKKMAMAINYSSPNPSQKEFHSLVNLLQNVPETTTNLVQSYIQENPASVVMMNFALYSADRDNAFSQLLINRKHNDKDLSKDLMRLILNKAILRESDFPYAMDLLLDIAEYENHSDLIHISLIIDSISNFGKVTKTRKERVISFAEHCIWNANLSDEFRAMALQLVEKINPMQAKKIAHSLEIAGNNEVILKRSVNEILEKDSLDKVIDSFYSSKIKKEVNDA